MQGWLEEQALFMPLEVAWRVLVKVV